MEHETFQIIKKDGVILWKSKFPEDSIYFTITSRSAVKNWETITCYECDSLLSTIKEEDEEKWYCTPRNSRYFCDGCYHGNKSDIDETILMHYDSIRKIPYRMKDIEKDIMIHRNYNKLDICTRMEYEGAILLKSQKIQINEQNKYIKKIWRHLYYMEKL